MPRERMGRQMLGILRTLARFKEEGSPLAPGRGRDVGLRQTEIIIETLKLRDVTGGRYGGGLRLASALVGGRIRDRGIPGEVEYNTKLFEIHSRADKVYASCSRSLKILLDEGYISVRSDSDASRKNRRWLHALYSITDEGLMYLQDKS